jgi:hypothetical protein
MLGRRVCGGERFAKLWVTFLWVKLLTGYARALVTKRSFTVNRISKRNCGFASDRKRDK